MDNRKQWLIAAFLFFHFSLPVAELLFDLKTKKNIYPVFLDHIKAFAWFLAWLSRRFHSRSYFPWLSLPSFAELQLSTRAHKNADQWEEEYILLGGFWNVLEFQPGSAKPVLSFKLQIHWLFSAVFLEQIWEGLMFLSPLEEHSLEACGVRCAGFWANWFVLIKHWSVTLENSPALWWLILAPDVACYCGMPGIP